MSSESSPDLGMAAYRAPSLFQPHRARQALQDAHTGKIDPLTGCYLALSTVQTARLIASLGFDMVWIDWEHSACDVETMTTMVHEIMFISEGRTIPFVRVPGNDHAAIGFALDTGASIVIPQVETVEEAKHAVCAAKFGVSKQPGRPAPRSAPPFRYLPGVTDIRLNPSKTFHQNLNDQAAIMIQIETLEGLRNLDAILTEVPEIDCVWLGTLDFRVSMHLDGNNGMGGPEKEWTDCVDEYQRIVDKHNKPRAGFSFGPPEVLLKAGAGKCMNIVAADGAALMGLMEAGQVAKKTLPRLNGGRKLNGTANGTTNGFAEHTEA